jgi:hypothetical protein
MLFCVIHLLGINKIIIKACVTLFPMCGRSVVKKISENGEGHQPKRNFLKSAEHAENVE